MAKNTYKKVNKKKSQKTVAKPSLSVAPPAFLKNRRFQVVSGLFLIAVAVFTFSAICSYFFTGKYDQSVVESFLQTNVRESGVEVQNWLGLIGAVISHSLVFKWFGIGAVLIPPFLFLAGHKIIFHNKIDLVRLFYFTAFFLIWGSLLLGYLLYASDEISELGYLSGGIGYQLSVLFNSLFGFGTIVVLLFTFGAFTVYFVSAYELHKLILAFKTSQKTSTRTRLPAVTVPVEEIDDDEEDNGEYQFDEEQINEVKKAVKEEVIKELELDKEIILEPSNRKKPSPTPVSNKEKEKPTPTPSPKKSKGLESFELIVEKPLDDGERVETKVVPSDHVIPPAAPPVRNEEQVSFQVEKPASEKVGQGLENYDPTLDLGTYQYPSVELLKDYGPNKQKVSSEELEENKNRILETLINFKIGISSIKATIGPTVTLYEIIPEAGVKISKIKNLEDDIALSLAALGIRIIAPIPGKGTIGIEVPNKSREMVDMRTVVSTEKFLKSDKALPVVLGKTISNEVFVVDLAKMPHMLVAGATGQGKSVGINAILTSLLYKKHPSQLKFVLVDPKKVELTLYNKIERHYLAKLPNSDEAIITDTKKVIYTLNSLCIEMDTRYDLLKDANCRNIKEYNGKFVERRLNPEKGHRYLPYIVLIIDELADLMMTAGKEVETPIARLAQLARAIGIHLVVATQRPSVNVITGIIKANFPARLSFRVTSKVDSRTILDAGGAEQLIGMGDMLLSLGSDITRLQCAFVDTPEVESVCDFIGEQRGYPVAYQLPEFEGDEDSGVAADVLEDKDSMFDQAARLIVSHQQGSTSLIQRKLKLGYNRAGRIIDQLEAAGIVGPFEGSKAREVLVSDEYSLEQLLSELNK